MKQKVAVVCSSLDLANRSKHTAELCTKKLSAQHVETTFVDLRVSKLERFDNGPVYKTSEYRELHAAIAQADGLLLCTPPLIYNQSTGRSAANLKDSLR